MLDLTLFPLISTTLPPVGGGGTASIRVRHGSVLGTAPMAMTFDVIDLIGFVSSEPGPGEIYDPRVHTLYYFWDFGEGYNFQASTNLPDDRRNSRYATGPWAAHTYRAAGNYTVSCLIVEPSTGISATATLPVTITSADAQFDGANTIFLSPSGSFGNAPAGALQITGSDIGTALAGYVNGQEAAPKRLMLNRDENYTFAGYSPGNGIDFPSCHIVANAGPGARPVVTCTGGWYWNDTASVAAPGSKEFIFQNIDWQGPFDSTTNSGALFTFMFNATNPPGTFVIDGCRLSGFEIVTFGHAIFSCYNDSYFTDWEDAGLNDYGGETLAVVGSAIKSNPDSLVNSGGGMGAPFRGENDLTIFDKCDVYSHQGWSPYGSELAIQPCLRLNGEGTEDKDTLVTECILEGGHKVIQAANSGVGSPHRANCLIEKTYMIGDATTYNIAAISQACCTLRNNIFVYPNVDYTGWNNPITFIAFEYLGGDTANQAAPIRAYSNQMINLGEEVGPATEFSNNFAGSAFSALTVQNNIVYQPNAFVPATGDAPFAENTNQWPPINNGYFDNDTLRDPDQATPHLILDYQAQSGAFSKGSTLSGATSGAFAEILRVDSNGTTGRLWLGPLAGNAFVDNEAITDIAGGAALANGPARDSGQTATFAPVASSAAIGAVTGGLSAYDDFTGQVRADVLSGLSRNTVSRGAIEPALES